MSGRGIVAETAIAGVSAGCYTDRAAAETLGVGRTSTSLAGVVALDAVAGAVHVVAVKADAIGARELGIGAAFCAGCSGRDEAVVARLGAGHRAEQASTKRVAGVASFANAYLSNEAGNALRVGEGGGDVTGGQCADDVVGVASACDEGESVDVVIELELGGVATAAVVVEGVGRLAVVPHVPNTDGVAGLLDQGVALLGDSYVLGVCGPAGRHLASLLVDDLLGVDVDDSEGQVSGGRVVRES